MAEKLSAFVGKRVRAIYMTRENNAPFVVLEFEDGSQLTTSSENSLFDADGMYVENDVNYRP